MVYYLNFWFEIIFAIAVFGNVAGVENELVYNYSRRKKYCILAGAIWILISGLRSLSVGADTYGYYQSFESVKFESFESLLAKFLLNRPWLEVVRDPGYYLLVKIFQFFSGDNRVFLLFIATVFMIPFAFYVLRDSENPMLSFLLYSTLFYSFFSITGQRQTIATALAVLIGDKFIKERKLIPFLLLVLIASTIHRSSLIFLPFYFMAEFPITKKAPLIWTPLFILSFIFRAQIKDFLIDESGSYASFAGTYNGAGTPVFTVLLVIILILAFLTIQIDRDIERHKRLYNGLFAAMLFTPLTWLNPSAMRIVQYFSLYLVLLLPVIVNRLFKKETRTQAVAAIILILFILLIRTNPSYSFFWSE